MFIGKKKITGYKRKKGEIVMSTKNKALFIQAILGGILITVLLMPFQALTPYVSYTWMIFIPIILFFCLGVQCKLVPPMFLSYVCGAIWGIIFKYLAGVMSAAGWSPALTFGILTTVIVFAILAVHPILLGKTPFGMAPIVLIGLVETIFTFLIQPANAPVIDSLQLIFFFAYGLALSFLLVQANEFFCKLFLGEDWAKTFEG